MDGSELLQIFRTDAGGPLWMQVAFAAGWIAGYVLWTRVYFRVVDPALRAALAAWAGEPVQWVLRRGTLGGGNLYFGLRYDTWSWGLAPRDDVPFVKDGMLYVMSVVVVYVVAATWPVAVLYWASFVGGLLSPPFVMVLFFLLIPLYRRWWSGGRRVGS